MRYQEVKEGSPYEGRAGDADTLSCQWSLESNSVSKKGITGTATVFFIKHTELFPPCDAAFSVRPVSELDPTYLLRYLPISVALKGAKFIQ